MIDTKNIVTKETKSEAKGVMKYCPKCDYKSEVKYPSRCPIHNVLILEKEEYELQVKNLHESYRGLTENSKAQFTFKKGIK